LTIGAKETLADLFDETAYKAKKSEIIYISNESTIGSQVSEMKPLQVVTNVKNLYVVSTKETDILGNGAFGIVRRCKQKLKKN
jgi:hypothetical protein